MQFDIEHHCPKRVIKIPDATPEIISAYALNDEQALLAKVRYNRLIDLFLGITANSLQNHMRTTVKGIGQIEIDEVYVALDRRGIQYVIPVQAKGGKDQLSVVQTFPSAQSGSPVQDGGAPPAAADVPAGGPGGEGRVRGRALGACARRSGGGRSRPRR